MTRSLGSSEALRGQDRGLRSSWGDKLIQDCFLECEGEASLGLLGELSQKRRNEIIQRSKNRKGVLGTGAGPAEAGKQFDFAGA